MHSQLVVAHSHNRVGSQAVLRLINVADSDIGLSAGGIADFVHRSGLLLNDRAEVDSRAAVAGGIELAPNASCV